MKFELQVAVWFLLKDRVCEHVQEGVTKQLFGSAQCIGDYGEKANLTKEMCAPSLPTIVDDVRIPLTTLLPCFTASAVQNFQTVTRSTCFFLSEKAVAEFGFIS